MEKQIVSGVTLAKAEAKITLRGVEANTTDGRLVLTVNESGEGVLIARLDMAPSGTPHRPAVDVVGTTVAHTDAGIRVDVFTRAPAPAAAAPSPLRASRLS